MKPAAEWVAEWPAQPSAAFVRRIQEDVVRAAVRIVTGQITDGCTSTPAVEAVRRLERLGWELEMNHDGKYALLESCRL